MFGEINVYKVSKNIHGLERNFIILTNTLFKQAWEIFKRKQKGEKVSDEDEQFLKNVEEQLSDRNLLSCQRKLHGYIGTVERRQKSSTIIFEPEEYGAYKEFWDKNINKDKYER